MPNERTVKILNIKDMDHNVAPYITEQMYEYMGKIYKVEYDGEHIDPETGQVIKYMSLKNNKYFWNPDWVSEMNITYSYENLMRLDL